MKKRFVAALLCGVMVLIQGLSAFAAQPEGLDAELIMEDEQALEAQAGDDDALELTLDDANVLSDDEDMANSAFEQDIIAIDDVQDDGDLEFVTDDNLVDDIIELDDTLENDDAIVVEEALSEEETLEANEELPGDAMEIIGGTDYDDALQIELNGEYTIKPYKGWTFYKIEVKESGRLSYEVDNGGGDRLAFRLGLKNISPSIYEANGGSKKSVEVDLFAGTYYFRNRSDDAPVNLKISFESAKESFKETYPGTNEKYSDANVLKPGNTYKGAFSTRVSNGTETDWYVFDMPASGMVSMDIKSNIKTIGWAIYDEDQKQIFREEIKRKETASSNEKHLQYFLNKGKYYISMQCYGREPELTGMYSFDLKFKDAKEAPAETYKDNNDELSKASSIKFDVDYKGMIGMHGDGILDVDCYVFNSPKNSEYRFDYIKTFAYDNGSYDFLTVALYDNDAKEIWKQEVGKQNKKDEISFELKDAGKYYLKVFFNSGIKKPSAQYFYDFKLHRHEYKESPNPAATLTKDGLLKRTCSCGLVTGSSKTIYMIKDVELNKKTVVYNPDKAVKPTVKVTDSKNNVIDKKYYKVSFDPANGKTVGEVKVTVEFKDLYSGKKTLKYVMNPAPTTVSKVETTDKTMTVTVKKQAKETTGYEIEYSTDKNFKKSATKSVSFKNSKAFKKITGLKAATTYYVRVRTYKTVAGKNYNSSWSDYSKTIKTQIPATKISSIKAQETDINVTIKKQAKDTTGYEVEYSTDKNFKSSATKSLKVKNSQTSVDIEGLKSKKTYYVRVRTYKTEGNNTYTSGWSKASSIKTR